MPCTMRNIVKQRNCRAVWAVGRRCNNNGHHEYARSITNRFTHSSLSAWRAYHEWLATPGQAKGSRQNEPRFTIIEPWTSYRYERLMSHEDTTRVSIAEWYSAACCLLRADREIKVLLLNIYIGNSGSNWLHPMRSTSQLAVISKRY